MWNQKVLKGRPVSGEQSSIICGTTLTALLLVCAPCTPELPAFAADWPQWRYDAGRSAASPEELPAELHLGWVRRLPPPAPAWPKYPRLCFDVSYEPVVMGKTMFVPSMVTDSLTALDTDSGAERWRFYTDGPVRLAPVACNGKVYFASDDGHLYCLDAADGRLVWKFRGLPSDRKDRKVLGNDRLISLWPARGGPVLADGKVYFGAGVWPFEGVYVYALDAQTGKLVWSNKDGCHVKDGLLDHGTRRDGCLSPQGYLAVLGEKVIVPGGRALPGFFDRSSGRMDPYTSGWGGRVALAKGCWYVCGIGNYFFQSGDVYGLTPSAASVGETSPSEELLSLEAFAERANVPPETVERWVKDGNVEAVEQDGKRLVRSHKPPTITYLSWWTSLSGSGEKHVLHAYPRLQVDPANVKELGVFRVPILTEQAIYYSRPINKMRGYRPAGIGYDAIMASRLTNPKWGVTCQGGWGNPMRLVQWKTVTFNQIWSLASEFEVHIKSGPRLYGGADGVVAAVDVPDQGGSPKVSWKADIEGTPSRMLAADGKLFVVTSEGSIYAFGPNKAEPKVHTVADKELSLVSDPRVPEAGAGNILKATGAKEGYCLVLGAECGPLAAELAKQSKLHVIAVDPDAANVRKLRGKLDEAGLYGRRIVVDQGDPLSYPFPPYLASLIVSEVPAAVGPGSDKTFLKQVFRSLRPYGGVACLHVPPNGHDAFAASVKGAGLAGAEVERAGEFALVRRVGPLPGSADWTHVNADAGNSLVSRDKRVKPPFGVLWFGGSVDMLFPEWDYTHSCSATPLVVGGRMFFQVFPKLHAVDIYTGRHLWTSTLPGTELNTQRRNIDYVATEDSVYVASGKTCVCLDAATGSTLSEIPSPVEGANWRQVRLLDGFLVGATEKVLVCMDRRGGKANWKYQARKEFAGLAVGGGRVFCADASLPDRRGEVAKPEGTLVALDIHDGNQLWQAPIKVQDQQRRPLWLAYCEANDVLLAVYKTVSAHAGKDGSLLWDKAIEGSYVDRAGGGGPMLHRDRLITQIGQMYDPRTGSQLPGRLWGGEPNHATRGCNRAIGGEHLAFIRDAHASYFDLSSCRQTYFRGVRSGCTNGLIAADGLLNAPDFAHGCSCNYAVFASLALVHVPEDDE